MKSGPPSGASTEPAAAKSLNRGSQAQKKLWAYIKKNGLRDSNRRRPIFDSPVALRNLGASDIRLMVSNPKIELG
jgi:hypothetical protein